MNSQDRENFNKALKLCIAATGKSQPESISTAFWVVLEPYPLQEVVKALKMRMSDPDKGRFIPAAAEILELIEKNRKPKNEPSKVRHDDHTSLTLQLGQKPTDLMVEEYQLEFMKDFEGGKTLAMRYRTGGKGLADGFRQSDHDKLLESRKPDPKEHQDKFDNE